MAEVIGLIGKDAVVKTTTKGDVVEFSVAENFKYKSKKTGKTTTKTTWYNCSYWNATNLASHLKKGVAVMIKGQPVASSYTGTNGEAKASIKFTIHNFNFLPVSNTKGKEGREPNETPTQNAAETTHDVVVEDLPF